MPGPSLVGRSLMVGDLGSVSFGRDRRAWSRHEGLVATNAPRSQNRQPATDWF